MSLIDPIGMKSSVHRHTSDHRISNMFESLVETINDEYLFSVADTVLFQNLHYVAK